MLKWGANKFHGKDGFQHRPMKDVGGGGRAGHGVQEVSLGSHFGGFQYKGAPNSTLEKSGRCHRVGQMGARNLEQGDTLINITEKDTKAVNFSNTQIPPC